MKRLLELLLATAVAVGITYVMFGWATRPILVSGSEDDPTGKKQIQQEVQEGYEKYMEERGL